MTVATLSELPAVAVDGEPFVTAGPDTGLLAHCSARPRAAQRGLPFAGPRQINGHVIGSPVVRAHAAFPLTCDERSPIRCDTLRLAVRRLRGIRTDVDRRTDRCAVAVRREH